MALLTGVSREPIGAPLLASISVIVRQGEPMRRRVLEAASRLDSDPRLLAAVDLAMAEGITHYRRVISFRNILAHGYAGVDDMLVWDMVRTRLGDLLREVDELLATG